MKYSCIYINVPISVNETQQVRTQQIPNTKINEIFMHIYKCSYLCKRDTTMDMCGSTHEDIYNDKNDI